MRNISGNSFTDVMLWRITNVFVKEKLSIRMIENKLLIFSKYHMYIYIERVKGVITFIFYTKILLILRNETSALFG